MTNKNRIGQTKNKKYQHPLYRLTHYVDSRQTNSIKQATLATNVRLTLLLSTTEIKSELSRKYPKASGGNCTSVIVHPNGATYTFGPPGGGNVGRIGRAVRRDLRKELVPRTMTEFGSSSSVRIWIRWSYTKTSISQPQRSDDQLKQSLLISSVFLQSPYPHTEIGLILCSLSGSPGRRFTLCHGTLCNTVGTALRSPAHDTGGVFEVGPTSRCPSFLGLPSSG